MSVELHDRLEQQQAKHPVLEVHVTGKLRGEDYQKFLPRIEALIRQHGKIRLLLYLHKFAGWTVSALWDDAAFDIKHFRDIEKLAVVGESIWHEGMTAFWRPFTTAQIRYFDHDQLPAARCWIDAAEKQPLTETEAPGRGESSRESRTMTDPNKERRETVERLAEIVSAAPVAMLTTRGEDGALHSRPMVNVNRQFEGDLWFLSHRDDPKVHEIEAHPQVNVSFAVPEHDCYVSLAGEASVVEDRKRIELLFTPSCDAWFPDGPDDPALTLLKVDIGQAEYWKAEQTTLTALRDAMRRLVGRTSSGRFEHHRIDWRASAESAD